MRSLSATLLLAAAILPATVQAEEWKKTWTVSGKPDLRVSTDDGSVKLMVGSNRQIEALVLVTGWRIDSEVRITERQTGDRIELEVKLPKGSSWNWSGGNNRSIRVELRVPAELAADIRTGDGHIEMAGVKGSIRAKSGDGHVDINGMEGTLDVSTGDGRIRARGKFDTLNLTTGDGGIDADVLAGSKVAVPWRITTGDGSVTVRLPETLAAEVDVRTGDGRVTCDLPLTTQGSMSEHGIRGRLNGGGPVMTIRSGDGSIKLARL